MKRERTLPIKRRLISIGLCEAHIPGNKNVFFGGGTSTTPAATPPAVNFGGSNGSRNQITSGVRSGGAAVSPNAIDALLFGEPAAKSAPAPAKAPALAALTGVFTDPQFQIVTRSLDQKKGVDLLASSSVTTKSGQRADSLAQPKTDEPQMSGEEAKRQRSLVRQFFRALGPTKEWAETDYYQVPLTSQNVGLIPINAFWRDYAAWDGKSPFISANFAEAAHSFSEMMLALAVLDLPFSSPKHDVQKDAAQYTVTAGGSLVAFHKGIETAAPPRNDIRVFVSENFFQSDDRYREQGNEKSEKYVTGEFVAGVVYGTNVVVTNPLSSPQVMDLLLQIPEGAIPVNGSRIIDSKRFRLEPYTTQTFGYYFYFPTPRPEPFSHHPASVTRDGRLASTAKPTSFKVVRQLSEVDKTSWDYISQFGSEADVFAFLYRNNIVRIDLARVAWRARKSVDFYHKIIALPAARHVYNDILYSYSVFHNDAPAIGEWLRHRGDFGEDFIGECGPWVQSSLLAIDPIERRAYQHLEYSPLVNQRIHRLGGEDRIPSPILREQYLSLLNILAFKPNLDAMDQMSLVYYLLLQDRTEEALARFHAILPKALPTRLQYDYFSCYAAFFEERLADARGIANQYSDYLVDRWRKLFAGVAAQLDEIEGKAALAPSAAAKTPATASGAPAVVIRHSELDISSGVAREMQQGELAATEPSFDFKVENHQITLTWKNMSEVTVRYYLMDPEFLFSASPFVTADSTRAAIIKPTKSVFVKLPQGKDALQIPLPEEFGKANVLVEIVGAGQHKSQAFHAGTLKLAVAENYGHLELRDQEAGKPVAKAYIKVYARLKGGAIRFFKDGYTDLRGKFDYSSLNSSDAPVTHQSAEAPASAGEAATYQMLQPREMRSVEKLSILVLSDAHGVMVREVNPPSE